MSTVPCPGGTVLGTVEHWDEPRGVGTVLTDDGRSLGLQCTNLVDGSRTTTPGTRVRLRVAPAHHGRWQAIDVAPLASG